MNNWNKHTDKPDKKIYYRQEQGVKALTLYIEALYECPMINLVSILAEVGLFKEWIPLTKNA